MPLTRRIYAVNAYLHFCKTHSVTLSAVPILAYWFQAASASCSYFIIRHLSTNYLPFILSLAWERTMIDLGSFTFSIRMTLVIF